MNKDQLANKVYHLSVTAGMNQRYHQDRAFLWTLWDRICKIIVAALAVAALCLCVVTAVVEGVIWDEWSIGVAIAAAVAAIALNVLPLGDWASQHNALFERWTDYREDVDSQFLNIPQTPTADDLIRLKELDARMHRICGSEPAPSKKKLQQCFDVEEESRRASTKRSSHARRAS